MDGLYRSPSLKTNLEERLAQHKEITTASANILTGAILVIFELKYANERILAIVDKEISAFLERRKAQLATAPPTIAVSQSESTERAATKPKTKPAIKAQRKKRGDIALFEAQPSEQWHLMEADAVLAAVDSSRESGLSSDAIKVVLKRFGANVIPKAESRSGLSIFLEQFNSIPVFLLTAAAGISALTGGLIDAAVVMAVVGLNAVIGYVTESAAEKTIRSMRSLIRPNALVKREGEIIDIDAEDVALGDVLVLKPGVYAVADARLIESSQLHMDESALTGESMPARKNPAPLEGARIPLGDRSNMIYSGTIVTGGQGTAVVVATGRFSQMGQIQELLSQAEAPETPVERELASVGNQLVYVSSGICAVIMGIGFLWGMRFIELLKNAISLAVAAVPEGLPTVATTTLALGVRHMKKHKVHIRNMEAVTTLGSVQTLCLDKTGTITENRMSVLRVVSGLKLIDVQEGKFFSDGLEVSPTDAEEFLRLMQVCVLCNESEMITGKDSYALNGSSTENALIELAIYAGIDVLGMRDSYPMVETNYRTETSQFMSTAHKASNGDRLVAIKGSPVEVLSMCSSYLTPEGMEDLDNGEMDWFEDQNDRLAGEGLRVLGLAYSMVPERAKSGHDQGLVWLGLVGMADPIRSGVHRSIKEFHSAGVDTVMITGDQSATAQAVGTELDLNRGETLRTLDSSDLAGIDPAIMQALFKEVKVFSRVSPSNKLEIVQALQSAGRVVGMTGDGINDGPALRAADIGIAMGRTGTDVAREVADVVLEEDNLETLIIAVSDGRTIYNNIKKSLHFLLSTNFSEILFMFLTAVFGMGHPINAMQLLWINLISDVFPGLALAMEPPEPDVLAHPPRDPAEPILKGADYKRITFEAGTITLSALAAYTYGIVKFGRGPAAGSMAFQSLTTAQILHALSCRSDNRTLIGGEKLPRNKYLEWATLGSLVAQVATVLVPGLRALLKTTPISAVDALLIAGSGLLPLIVSEATKSSSREDNQ